MYHIRNTEKAYLEENGPVEGTPSILRSIGGLDIAELCEANTAREKFLVEVACKSAC